MNKPSLMSTMASSKWSVTDTVTVLIRPNSRFSMNGSNFHTSEFYRRCVLLITRSQLYISYRVVIHWHIKLHWNYLGRLVPRTTVRDSAKLPDTLNAPNLIINRSKLWTCSPKLHSTQFVLHLLNFHFRFIVPDIEQISYEILPCEHFSNVLRWCIGLGYCRYSETKLTAMHRARNEDIMTKYLAIVQE